MEKKQKWINFLGLQLTNGSFVYSTNNPPRFHFRIFNWRIIKW